MSLTFTLSACKSVKETVAEVFAGIVFVGAVIASNDSVPKHKIFKFVNEHKDKLEECIQKGDFSEFEDVTIVKDIYKRDTYTEFYCGGKGIASSSYYCGFFYSPQDDKNAKWEHLTLTPDGKGYVNKSNASDNIFYCEKITDCFYFYEESY